VEAFLELLSEDNYDAFCLAYMFTYRDFDGGTLGLAWTGDVNNAGGVCERNGVRLHSCPTRFIATQVLNKTSGPLLTSA